MKVLLIQPPIEDYYATAVRSYPLGLTYIASAVQYAGHEAVILDTLTGYGHKTISTPKAFNYLKDYYIPGNKSPFRLFGNYYHFGMSFDKISESIKNENPDIVAISSLFTAYHSTALKVAEISKQVLPNVRVIMGGGHPSALGEDNIQSPYVDKFIFGEGELGIIKYLTNKKVELKKELPAARELLDHSKYLFGKKRMAFMLTSRGCPYNCSFCSVHSIFNKFIVRNNADIINEIIELTSKYNVRHIDIEDDCFGLNKKKTISLLKSIIELSIENLTFSCMNGITAGILDEELLKLMKEAGFSEVNLSMVSCSDEICLKLQRPFSPSKFAETAKIANKLGLDVTAYYILGLPYENIEQIMNNLLFLNKLPVKIGASIFYPVPNTPIFDDSLAMGYINGNDFDSYRLTAASVETKEFNRNDLFTFFYLTRVLNHIKIYGKDDNFVQEFLTKKQILGYFKNGNKILKTSSKVLDTFFNELY